MKKSKSADDRLPQIVVCVPGHWTDADDAMHAIDGAEDGRYAAVKATEAEHGLDGLALLDQKTNWACTCQFWPRREGLEQGFAQMGFGRVPPWDVQPVKRHRGILILSAPGGSVETARCMMDATTAAVRQGGLGVIIESTGIAHSVRDWLRLSKSDDTAGGLYWAYVATIGPRGPNGRTIYTCGMHNLGHRDAITDMFDEPQEAAFIMHNFLGYVYQSGQPVSDGDEIGDEEGERRFRVLMEPCRTYPAEDLFHNPYGMWRIAPAEQ